MLLFPLAYEGFIGQTAIIFNDVTGQLLIALARRFAVGMQLESLLERHAIAAKLWRPRGARIAAFDAYL
jgi:hypothetical protein